MSIFFRGTFQRSFGTYPLNGEVLTASMIAAAEIGYRAFDTAQMYGNEKDVGAALAELDLPRAELCIATKVHPDKFSADRFIDSVTTSLRDLGLDYVDVLFVHWPPVGGDIRPSLELLEDAHRKGYAKHIAVSNYTAAMMQRRPAARFRASRRQPGRVPSAAGPAQIASRGGRDRHSAVVLRLRRARRGVQLSVVRRACPRLWPYGRSNRAAVDSADGRRRQHHVHQACRTSGRISM